MCGSNEQKRTSIKGETWSRGTNSRLPFDVRLFTVPYFFVRSFRYTVSYRHGYLEFQMYRGGGRWGLWLGGGGGEKGEKNRKKKIEKYFSRFLPNRPRPLGSFDTHARWVARNAKLSISMILRKNSGL